MKKLPILLKVFCNNPAKFPVPKITKASVILHIAFLISVSGLKAQGCSDAGICSIGHSNDEETAKNELEISSVFGAGESDTRYISPFISYTRTFDEQWSGAVKITSSVASGQFGSVGSIGDVVLTVSRKILTERTAKWSFTAGTKIPLNRSNLEINGRPLPLDYQSSLGTFDFLGATHLHYRKWDFNAAVQIPIINSNDNSYFAENAGTKDFPSTNDFRRKPDFLLSGSYTHNTKNKKFSFRPGLILICHLGEDSYEDIFGNRKSITGSDGLTVNGIVTSVYHLEKSSIEFTLATPFAVREIRPDGLTREYTVGISYKVRF